MKLILHDLPKEQFSSRFPEYTKDSKIISPEHPIRPCVGCFGCWIKTPGQCVIKDGYENMGILFSQYDELVIISQCCFGCYSPFIKNVLDRSIGYVLPYFTTRDGKMCHKSRYKKRIDITAVFYGSHLTQDEKDTAEAIVFHNGRNFNAGNVTVQFLEVAQ